MNDVARLAGVGTMTVSRVLSGSVRVSEETAKRVHEAIAALNYRPNEVARALRERHSRQIGVLVPNLLDPFFAICAHTVSAVANEHGYSVIIATDNADRDKQYKEASQMLRRQVEGLVLVPAGTDAPSITPEEFRNLPVVSLDRPLENTSYDGVVVENKFGAQLGVNHLIQHGHKRIAFFGLLPQMYTIKLRHEGYCEAMGKAGLELESHFGNATQEEMVATMRSVLSGSNPPTAIFCGNNLIARNAFHALCHLQVRIPDAMALVGFDDFETANILNPALTVVRQPITEMARIGANLLFSQLWNKEAGFRGKITVLPVELVVRDSCGRHPEAQ